jgi:transcription initiation factor IIE alpha subunit
MQKLTKTIEDYPKELAKDLIQAILSGGGHTEEQIQKELSAISEVVLKRISRLYEVGRW